MRCQLIAPPLRKSDSPGVEVNLVVAVNSFAPQLYEQHCHVPPPPSPPVLSRTGHVSRVTNAVL